MYLTTYKGEPLMLGRYHIATLVCAALLCASGNPVHAASFDCAKAKSIPEQLICANPDLSRLDDQLASLYMEARDKAIDKAAFRESQRQAWNWREKNCTDKDCLLNWFADRRDTLQRIVVTGRAGPAPTATIGGLPSAAPAPRIVYVTPDQVERLYRENAIAANRQYETQRFNLQATVASVGIDNRNQPYIAAIGALPGHLVKIEVSAAEADTLANLHSLDVVKMGCVSKGWDTTDTIIILSCSNLMVDLSATQRSPYLPTPVPNSKPLGAMP